MPSARSVLAVALLVGAVVGAVVGTVVAMVVGRGTESATTQACRIDDRLIGGERTALLASCERAVPAVLEAWPQWSPAVDITRASSPLPGGIAARVEGEGREGEPTTGDRLVVAPDLPEQLSSAGLDVVLRHELTHLAMRSTETAPLPLWVAEGVAEHVGYASVADERRERAADLERLRGLVTAGTWTTTVPTKAQLEGGRTGAEEVRTAYISAWLAVTVLVEERGLEAVTDAMRPGACSERTDADPEARFLARLGLTRADLDRLWRARLEAPS